jgi:ribonuclease D
MGDSSKIKIFHAYENDVKWLHEDYNLHGVGNKVQK